MAGGGALPPAAEPDRGGPRAADRFLAPHRGRVPGRLPPAGGGGKCGLPRIFLSGGPRHDDPLHGVFFHHLGRRGPAGALPAGRPRRPRPPLGRRPRPGPRRNKPRPHSGNLVARPLPPRRNPPHPPGGGRPGRGDDPPRLRPHQPGAVHRLADGFDPGISLHHEPDPDSPVGSLRRRFSRRERPPLARGVHEDKPLRLRRGRAAAHHVSGTAGVGGRDSRAGIIPDRHRALRRGGLFSPHRGWPAAAGADSAPPPSGG